MCARRHFGPARDVGDASPRRGTTKARSPHAAPVTFGSAPPSPHGARCGVKRRGTARFRWEALFPRGPALRSVDATAHGRQTSTCTRATRIGHLASGYERAKTRPHAGASARPARMPPCAHSRASTGGLAPARGLETGELSRPRWTGRAVAQQGRFRAANASGTRAMRSGAPWAGSGPGMRVMMSPHVEPLTKSPARASRRRRSRRGMSVQQA